MSLQEQSKQLKLPDYKAQCLVNIPQHIKFLHGLTEKSLLVNQTQTNQHPKKSILFVLDGFGYKQWLEQEATIPLLTKLAQSGSLTRLTSLFPSSTAISLSSLSTGLTTQQHGLVEWWMYSDELDKIIVTLPFMPIGSSKRDQLLKEGADPRLLLNARTLFEDLENSGVKSCTLIHSDYANGAYSSLAYKDSKMVAHQDLAELFTNLKSLLLNNPSERVHFNVYWSNIDTTGHRYGPDSQEYAAEVASFFKGFEDFLAILPEGADLNTELMITSDHGQIRVDPGQTIWLDEYPEVKDNLAISKNGNKILPWGSQRVVFMRIETGKLEEVYKFLSKELHGKALVIKSIEALEAGLFGYGELHPDFKDRIDNLMVLPEGNRTAWYRHYEGEIFRMRGMHGGLTPDELYVPFLSLSL